MNRVKWESLGNGVWPVPGEVLYREECAQPVLIFVNYEQWRDEPDTEIVLVTNDGVEVKWLPLTDEYGIPIVPTGENYLPMLMDFGIWGYVTGLDYPEDWEPSGDDWWLPPTDWGLAYTNWTCEHWYMEFGWGDSDPETATRTIPVPPSSITGMRKSRSMSLPILASGEWRMTAFIWKFPTAREAIWKAVFRC